MTVLVRRWEASNDSRQVFARRHGVTVACLDYWKRRVPPATTAAPRVPFAPVRLVPDPPRAAAAIEVVLVSGERLTIPDGVSRDQVRAVLTALRSAC